MKVFHSYENYDEAPFKGHLTLTATNNTNTTWTDFHFFLFDFYPYQSDVVFVDGSLSWCPSGSCNPTKNPESLDSWNISTSGKTLDLYFGSSPIYNGQTVTFEVYTDNTANQQPFGLAFYPTTSTPIVPEPVSTTLFIVGAATLGFRRFRKKA